MVKIGRPHLQDATPLTLGPHFRLGGDARAESEAHRQQPAASGGAGARGTAVGTGSNTPPEYRSRGRRAGEITGAPFVTAPQG
ncbi:lyase family protein [Shigella flexneri]